MSDATARQELLAALAEAVDQIALSLGALGEAYEQLDEFTGDRLEEQLFRPVQAAYGRAQRTHAEFAERVGLPARDFAPVSPGLASQGPKRLVERGSEAARAAGDLLGSLQDSMAPMEFGDAELRAGLSEVRRLLGDVPGRARELVRTLGR